MTEASVTFLQRKIDNYLHWNKRGLYFSEVLKEFSELRNDLERIIPFLRNADLDVLGFGHDEKIYTSKKLRNAFYDMEDEVEKMMRPPTLLWGCHRPLPFWWHCALYKNLNDVHEVRGRIQRIMDKLKVSSNIENGSLEKGESSISPEPDESYRESMLRVSGNYLEMKMVGFKDYKQQLEELLLQDREKQLKVISVTGMAGIGKTTLVKKVYNSNIVKSSFECLTWVYISRFLRDVLRAMLNGFFFGTAPYALDSMDEQELQGAIHSYLCGKSYLIVMDAVWNISFWEFLAPAFPKDCGGRIIWTTCERHLVDFLDIPHFVIKLEPLKYDDSLALFCQRAFLSSPPPELLEKAKILVERLRGLPLAIVHIASSLRQEMSPQAWDRAISLIKESMFRAIRLNYKGLTYPAKLLFLSLSMFPEEEEIWVKRFIRLWVAEGFVEETPDRTAEEVAEACFKQLIIRSMIDPVRIDVIGNLKSFKLHIPLRHLGRAIIENNELREFCTTEKEHGYPNIQCLRRHTQNMPSKKIDLANLRYFAIFGIETVPSSLMDLLPSKFQLLRVLDLRGVRIKILPSGLGTLFHLRYLGLRRTHIIDLPSSLSRLHHLRTLDIKDTQVRRLRGWVVGLMQLRHIHLASALMTKVVELSLETGMLIAPQIQTLAGVRGTTRLVQELQSWTQLRKLSIGRVIGCDSEILCRSINKMSFLRSLSIKCDGGQSLQLESLTLCSKNLETLRIGGPVKPFAHLVNCFRPNLCRLYLWDNMLKEDPFSSLQHLPNLIVLSLSNAYTGKFMECCAGGFPKLKNLSILRMTSLECGTIELGGMKELENLFIGHCPNLKKLFQGLIGLSALHIVKVSEMADEFVEVLEKNVKDHNLKVQQQHMHVEENAKDPHVIVQKMPLFVSKDHHSKVHGMPSERIQRIIAE
ncbi:hypothetical protein HHK36_005002 [Tetracentron sinense]|uniref:NB-ARC domain-containing protein n=1 Tax=Tetracentron sinense TaxID=13715 RepID=A0A835DQR1_TETSI|nr:hypothetical protein HHK36_005002 [Tetracentron sinense]